MRVYTVPHRTSRRHERLAVVSPATLFIDSEAGEIVGHSSYRLDISESGARLRTSAGEIVGHSSYTLDISERGARLRTSAIALSPGQTVVVLPHGEAPRRAVRGRVAWIREAGSDQERELGLEFHNPTPTTCWCYASDRKGFNAAKFLGRLLNLERERR